MNWLRTVTRNSSDNFLHLSCQSFIWLTVFGLFSIFESSSDPSIDAVTLQEFSRLHCCLFVKDQMTLSHRLEICITYFFIMVIANLRRRRDLNPRAAINDLHPFQGCPFGQLGYFSEFITLCDCPFS